MKIDNLSTTDLQRELARREKSVSKLQARRDRIAKELGEVDAEIAALGGGKAPRRGRRTSAKGKSTGRTRTKNKLTLADAIARSMEVRAVVSPAEAAKLVQDNGYTTTSKTFGVQVASTLAKDERFKRVGRGQYERVK